MHQEIRTRIGVLNYMGPDIDHGQSRIHIDTELGKAGEELLREIAKPMREVESVQIIGTTIILKLRKKYVLSEEGYKQVSWAFARQLASRLEEADADEVTRWTDKPSILDGMAVNAGSSTFDYET